MERARKSPSRQRDVVEAAAEVVVASEESFKTATVEAEPEVFLADEEVVEAVVEQEPEPVIEDAAAVEEQPEAVVTAAVAVEEGGAEVVIEPEAVKEAAEITEIHALTEAVSEAKSPEDDRALQARAGTNGNAHKPPLAHEVVVEINGHKSNHAAVESTYSGSVVPDDLPPAAPEETVPSMNGHATANGHAADVTSLNGEGTTASANPGNYGDVEMARAGDDPKDVVHEVRVDASTNGGDETISIQIGIHLQSRALRMKRWDVKEEPFEGFKSPPGRF